MADLRKIIEAKLDIYDNADEDFLDDVSKTEKAILKRVLGLLNKFDTVDGRLVNNETSLQLINELNKEIAKIVKQSTFTSKVDDYLKNFDEIDKLNRELQLEVNGLKLTKTDLNPIKTQSVKDLSKALSDFPNLDANIVNPIKQIVFNSVVTSTPIDEAKNIISALIAGNEQRHGHMRRWVSQIARDSITQYDGLVNDVIAKEYNLDAYRYVGSLIEDSRPQCIRWVGKQVLPIDTLESEIKWAENNGRGMNPNTTPDTFARYRGGYNCRHMAIPTRLVTKT